MGEVDMDPIKSVRASVFHFGEKFTQIKSRSSSDDELDKEKDFESVLRDLANCKVQLEAMDASHKQALLNKEKTVDELSMLLKTSEFEKDIYINECKEAKIRVSALESKAQQMANELFALESTQAELLRVEKQLVEALKQTEVMETQVKYIELLESELTQLRNKLELKEQSELTELEAMTSELEEIRDRENKAQVEIALLKAELHKERSKTAAAEAAELKAKGEKSAAYFALQQMAIETQQVKEENQRLQSEHEEIRLQDSNSQQHEITITLQEYETLVKISKENNSESQMESKSQEEVEDLKKDLESAVARVSELRNRAEQAATRAEVAEQAKAALEEQMKGWKEQKQRRRAALAALRAESMSRSARSIEYDEDPKTYMPLGKFLKMKI